MNSLHRRRSTLTSGPFRRLTTQWRTLVWLTLVWVALWGEVSVGNILG